MILNPGIYHNFMDSLKEQRRKLRISVTKKEIYNSLALSMSFHDIFMKEKLAQVTDDSSRKQGKHQDIKGKRFCSSRKHENM